MRSFKFRAWVKFDSGNYGMLNHDNLLEWSLAELLEDEGTDVLMQSTGMYDRNRKEIYEGDILKDRKFIERIIWSNSEALFLRVNQYGWVGPMKQRMGEVIGNIHENPELLKA